MLATTEQLTSLWNARNSHQVLTLEEFISFCQTEETTAEEAADAEYMHDRIDVWLPMAQEERAQAKAQEPVRPGIEYKGMTAAEALAHLQKTSVRYQTVKGRRADTKSRRQRTFFLSCEVSLPIPGTDNYYRTHQSVELEFKAVVKMLEDMAKRSVFEDKGARLSVGVSECCVFLGGYQV